MDARPEHSGREGERERGSDRHGASAGCHRRDDSRHAARRAGAPRPSVRPRHPLCGSRYGYRHHHRKAGLLMTESTNMFAWKQDADGIVTLTMDDPNSSVNTLNHTYAK